MTASVTIVDYDCGNLFSVSHAIEHCGGRVELATDPEQVTSADRLLLPGVGAFGAAMNALGEQSGLRGTMGVSHTLRRASRMPYKARTAPSCALKSLAKPPKVQ